VSDLGTALSCAPNEPASFASRVEDLVTASQKRSREDASLVFILDGKMTGEMHDATTGARRAFFVFPLRIVNEAPRALTPESSAFR
jgi:hypothetical protein